MPTYTIGIPQPTQSLGITNKPIRENFEVLNTTLDIDHVAMVPNPNSPGNIGKHRHVHLPVKAAAPAANASEGILYTKSVASTGTELFYRRASNSTVQPSTEQQLTGRFLGQLADGYNYIGNGMIMQWGFQAATATSTGEVTIPITIAGLWNIQCTPIMKPAVTPNGGTTVQVRINSSTKFQWYFNTNSTDYTGFNWLVIGSLP